LSRNTQSPERVSTRKGKVTDCSNNFSVTIAGLSDALTRGGASLSAANNSLEESIALTATANEVMQNPQVVGQALKTISMRIRGVVTDEDEDGDTVLEPAKLGKLIQDITAKYTEDGKGISILASPDEFKSTYQILLELSKVWDKLTDTERAYVLERTAGKHRATVLQAILSNEETLVKSYETALNSAGSAMEEFEKRTESIEYHLNQLKAAWQELATNSASTEFVNMLLDAAKALVELVSKVGALNLSVSALGAMAGVFKKLSIDPAMEAKFKSLYEEAKKTGGIVKAFGKEIDISNKNLEKKDKTLVKLSSSLKGFGSILFSAFKGFGVAVVLELAIGAIKNFVDKSKHEVSELSGEIDSVTASITSLKSEIDELSADGISTEGEQRRIALLQKQLELEEKLLKTKQDQKSKAVLKNADIFFNGAQGGIVSSEFEDAMKAAEKSAKAYEENITFLEQNAKTVENASQKMKEYSADVIGNQQNIVNLGQTITDYNKKQGETSELYSEAIENLKALYQYEDDLNWVIANGTAEQVEAAKAHKVNLALFIYEQEALLGLSDSYGNAVKKLNSYSEKHEKLNGVVEEANKSQKISKASLESLKKEYPELAKEIEDKSKVVNGSYVLEKEAVEALNEAFNESRKIQLQTQVDMTMAAINESNKRIDKYKEEASAILKIYEMSAKVAEQALSDPMMLPNFPKELLDFDSDAMPLAFENAGKSGNIVYDTFLNSLSPAQKAAAENVLAEQKRQKELLLELERLQAEIESIGSSTSGTGTSTTLSGDGDSSSIDVFDKYANALANAREEVESYSHAVEVAQARLDLNQSQEERTVELLTEEQKLYSDLISAQEAQYKITNDTLWLQMQQLETVKQMVAEDVNSRLGFEKYSADDVSSWTEADVQRIIEVELKLNVDEAKEDAELANKLNGYLEMRNDIHELELDWYDKKIERQQTVLDMVQSEIDNQNDILDQYDDARKFSEKILDLLGEVEGTENRRRKLIYSLNDSYEKQKQTIEEMYLANAAQMAELAKDMETNAQAYAKLQEQQEALELAKLDDIESQFNYKQELLELEKEEAEVLAESQIYGEQGREKWEDARQDEIDALQERIDEMDRQAEEDSYAQQMADYEEEIAEKEAEIADLYVKLNNLREQQTVQTLKEQEDGSFQWEYIEDQIAVNETLEEISDKQNEIEEIRNEIKEAQDEHALEMEKQVLQDKITAIEEEVDRRQELYDEEIDNIQETYDREMAILSRWLQDEIAHWQRTIMTAKENLEVYKETNVEGWNANTQATEEELTKLDEAYNTHFSSIVETIQNYATQAIYWINEIRDAEIEAARAVAEARREAAEAERESSRESSKKAAGGIKFVEANNFLARLHYGERVLTRQEAQQYNDIEDDIKSGRLASYFESAKIDAANSISSTVSQSINRVGGTTVPTASTTSTSFVIEHLELPNVQDSQDFANVLQSWARNEFGGLAQKAKIVRSK